MNWEACRKLSLQELLLKLLLVPKMPQPATAKIIIRFFFVEGHCQPAGECKKIILVVLTHCTLKIPATLMILVSQNEDDI